MQHLGSAALAILAAAAFAASDFTFQTTPSSGEFLQTVQGLSVRWELRPGNSPDSPGVPAPATVSVSLGFKDSADKPVVLFPPIGTNVPVAGLQFSWSPMTFDSFANGPVPARDANSNWFIVLNDQSTGYKSNGQVFHLIDAATSAAPSPSGAAAPLNSFTSSTTSTAGSTSTSVVPSAAPSNVTGASSTSSSSSARTTTSRTPTSSKPPPAPSATLASAKSSSSSVTAHGIASILVTGAGAALQCFC